MHLYVMARGQYRWLWDWVSNLSARYYPYKTEEGIRGVQLNVRPIQLFEIVFPEPVLNEVLSIVQPYDGGNTQKKRFSKGGEFSLQGKIIQKVMGLSRFAGLSKIPLVKPSPMIETVNPKKFVGVMGIGLKKDLYHPKTGIEML